jgi:predicted secreted protein
MAIGTSSGTTLEINDQAVAHLTSISGVSMSADTIDVTALDSNSGYREYLASFKDGGEVPVSGFFDYGDKGQQAIYTAYDTETTDKYTIKFPKVIGAQWSFTGVITAFETGAEVGNAVSFSATIKVSGKPTLSSLTTSTSEG